MKKSKLLSLAIFIVILSIYAILVALAFLYYPQPFSPLTNIPAELGNSEVNPSGALAYNVAILISSIPVVAIASLQLTVGRQAGAKLFKKGKAYFYLTFVFFLIFGVFNTITALIPLDMLYFLLSLTGFISLQLFIVISAVALRGNPNHTSWLPIMGFATVLLNVALMLSFMIAGFAFAVAFWIITVFCWAYVVIFMYEIA
jgi:hypothetical protein